MKELRICDACSEIFLSKDQATCQRCKDADKEDQAESYRRAKRHVTLRALKRTHGRPCDPPHPAIQEVR